MIPYGRHTLTDSDKKAVLDCLSGDFLTQGPLVEKFEKSFADYVQAPFATAVTNGTAALHLVMRALNVGPGDKVLVTTNSFVASANCVVYCGGEVEFVDIDPKTLCMCPELLRKKLQHSKHGTYKGIVVVDFAGRPSEIEEVSRIAKEYNLFVVQDSCHALGSEIKASIGKWSKTGSAEFADATVFSFHPVKHLATGEGGMITTRRQDLHEKFQLLRTHGITKNPNLLSEIPGGWYYEMIEEGYNYRLPDILCALGLSQIERLDENVGRRRMIAERYQEELRNCPIQLLEVAGHLRHSYHLYVIQTKVRRQLYDYLREKQILAQVHYIPIHTQPFYRKKYGALSLPNAEAYYSGALSIPMYHGLSDQEQTRVIESIQAFFKAH